MLNNRTNLNDFGNGNSMNQLGSTVYNGNINNLNNIMQVNHSTIKTNNNGFLKFN